MSAPFKMKGSSALGYGNQHSKGGMPMYDSPAPYASPAKDTGHAGSSEKQHHLTDEQKKKARYVELSEENEGKPGFNEARNKAFGGKTTVEGNKSTTVKPDKT